MNDILPFNIMFTFLCCHRHGISKAIAWFPRSRAGGRRWRRGRGYSSTSSFSTSTTFSSTFTKSLCFTSSESSTSNNHNWFHYSIHCSSITFRDMRQKKMKAECSSFLSSTIFSSSFLSSTIFRLHIVNYFCQCNPELQTEDNAIGRRIFFPSRASIEDNANNFIFNHFISLTVFILRSI